VYAEPPTIRSGRELRHGRQARAADGRETVLREQLPEHCCVLTGHQGTELREHACRQAKPRRGRIDIRPPLPQGRLSESLHPQRPYSVFHGFVIVPQPARSGHSRDGSRKLRHDEGKDSLRSDTCEGVRKRPCNRHGRIGE